MLIRQYGDTDFVTGLRALATIMVVAIHTGATSGFGTLGELINDNCRYGVQIFFTISGFTVAVTYPGAPAFMAYFGRRFFRIAPLFYLMCGLMFVALITGWLEPNYWMELYGSKPDFYNAFMHATFLNGWDARTAATIIGPDWTIPIEIFWYLFLPALLPFTATRRSFLWAMLALLVLSGLSRAVGIWLLLPHSAHFLPLTYGAYFLLGAVCLPLRRMLIAPEHEKRRRQLVWAGVGLIVLGFVTDIGFSSVFMSLATALLIAALHVPRGSFNLLTMRPVLYLGSISYSFYLWHYVLIMVLEKYYPDLYHGSGPWRFALVCSITLVLASITYILVERPSNEYGKRLTRRIYG